MRTFGVRLPVVCLFLLAARAHAQSQQIYIETFESGAPGWTFLNGATGLWRIAADGTCSAQTAMAAYNRPGSCTYNTGASNNGELISPPIVMSGQPPHSARFSSKRDMDVAADTACLRFRVVGAPDWEVLYCAFDNSGALLPASLELPTSTHGESVEFSFRVTANNIGNNQLGWEIDDFQAWNSGPPLPPLIGEVNPWYGPNTGVNGIVITGANFIGTSTILFGGTPATFNVDHDDQMTVNVPATPKTGYTDIVITNFWGTNPTIDAFDFFVPPATVGAACDAPYLTWDGSPTLGQTYRVTTENLGFNNQFLLVDWSNRISTQPFRRVLANMIGAPHCSVHVVPTSTISMGSTAALTFNIPNEMGLIGTHLRTQALVRLIGGRMVSTQALDVVIGE